MFSRGGARLGLRPRREDRHLILVVAAVGVVSGYAIWWEPLRQHFAKIEASTGNGAPSGPNASNAATSDATVSSSASTATPTKK